MRFMIELTEQRRDSLGDDEGIVVFCGLCEAENADAAAVHGTQTMRAHRKLYPDCGRLSSRVTQFASPE